MNPGVRYNVDLRSKFTSVVGLIGEGVVGESLYWSFKKSTVEDASRKSITFAEDVDQRSKNSVENTLRKKDSGCNCCDEEFKSLAIAIAMGAPTVVAKDVSNATTATVEATTAAANTTTTAASLLLF